MVSVASLHLIPKNQSPEAELMLVDDHSCEWEYCLLEWELVYTEKWDATTAKECSRRARSCYLEKMGEVGLLSEKEQRKLVYACLEKMVPEVCDLEVFPQPCF